MSAAVLNLLTESVPVLLTTQLPTFTEYITVFAPIAASVGLKSPTPLTAGFADQVPPPGAATRLKGLNVLHTGCGIVSVGVRGLLMVTSIVWVMGQLRILGVTVMLKTTVAMVTLEGNKRGLILVT